MFLQIYRTLHPDPRLEHLTTLFYQALFKKNPEIFLKVFNQGTKAFRHRLHLIAKSQFIVLRNISNNSDLIIQENLVPRDVQVVLDSVGSQIHEIFPKLVLPQKFSELTPFQKIVLMMLPLHNIVAALKPNKLICPTLLSPQGMNITDIVKRLERDIQLGGKSSQQAVNDMNKMNALSVCLANKLGLGKKTILLVGALHPSDYLTCLTNNFTEHFPINENEIAKLGITYPNTKNLTSVECKNNMDLFAKKWPVYARYIHFCFGKAEPAEVNKMKNEYRMLCYPPVETVLKQASDDKPEAELPSPLYSAFTGFSDEYAKSFDSLIKEWTFWSVFQFFFLFLGKLLNNNVLDNDFIEQVITELLFLFLVRAGTEIFSNTSDVFMRNMPSSVTAILKPIVDVSTKVALPLYSSYSSDKTKILLGLFSGYCGRKCAKQLISWQNRKSTNVNQDQSDFRIFKSR